MMEEQELVKQVLAGDPVAEETFFQRYHPRLLRAAAYFLGRNDSEAEDMVQETFIVAMRKLESFVFRAPIFAWLRQICLRLCYARLRFRHRILVSLEEDLERFMRGSAVERLEREENEVLTQQNLALLADLKQRLSPESRRIVELRDVQGLRYAQISKVLGIPMGTVMSRLARAREQLRQWVRNELEGEGSALNARAMTPMTRRGPPRSGEGDSQ